jgi:hypothetical protein
MVLPLKDRGNVLTVCSHVTWGPQLILTMDGKERTLIKLILTMDGKKPTIVKNMVI